MTSSGNTSVELFATEERDETEDVAHVQCYCAAGRERRWRAVTPVPKMPKALCLGEVIQSLNRTIRKLIGWGYSRQQVTELFNEQGVPASWAC